MQPRLILALCFFGAGAAQAQIQMELKLNRFQYVSGEPVIATVAITNLAGRPIELHDGVGQPWLGFELSGRDGRFIPSKKSNGAEATLNVQAGQTVSRR